MILDYIIWITIILIYIIPYDIDKNQGNILVHRDYWLDFEPDSNIIISALCPSGYCYIALRCYATKNGENSCESNADPSSLLCSKSINGYSKSLNSDKCVKCENGDNWVYLLIPILLSLCITLLLCMINTKRTEGQRRRKKDSCLESNKLCQVLSTDYFSIVIQMMILKNIMYYLQGMSQILLSSPTQIPVIVFASIFDLSMFIGARGNELCFIEGLTIKQKILWDLFMPAMLMVFIAMIYFIQ